ncbi:hypothetical protein BDY21DRAFT_274888, partial [Lineolata rhizophorae]
NDRRQRQNKPPGYAGQQGLLQAQAQYPPATSSDRFRQPPLTAQSPTSAPSTGRGASAQGYAYSYGEGSQFVGAGTSLQPASLQYPQEYSQESSRTPQQYSQYGSNVMYNVPTQQQPAAPQSPYESVQPYQQRQSAALDVLPNQFGVPQQYYVQDERGAASAGAAAAMATPNVQTQYPPMSYTQQSPVTRAQLGSTYATAMGDPSQVGSQGAYPQSAFGTQQPQPPQPQPQQQQQQQQQQSQPLAAAEIDGAFQHYQTEVRRTFEATRDGRLEEASGALMRISAWLVEHVEALGLVRDEENLHDQKLQIWDELNACWLAMLQKQKDVSMEFVSTGQRPIPPQSLVEYQQLEEMGKEVVRIGDILDKHGLVDYQMGWAEETI